MAFIRKILFLSLLVPCLARAGMVSVSGFSSKEIAPDIIHFSFSISNVHNRELESAKKEIDAKAAKLAKSLIEFGIKDKDITSPYFEVDGEPDRHEKCLNEWVPTVSRDFKVTLRDVKRYNNFLDLLVAHGVTKIDDIEGDVSEKGDHEEAVLVQAIEDAKSKANFLAKSFDSKVVRIKTIGKREENFEGIQEEELIITGYRATAGQTDAIPYEFRPENVTITASIYAEFEIK